MSAPNRDFPQVLKGSYDEAEERIRVDAIVTDGVDGLIINPDGSINVNVVSSPSGNEQGKSFFNEITSVASGVLTTILTYTVPLATDTQLERIEVSGTNIATFEVYLNAVIYARKRTYFGDSLNSTFEFSSETSPIFLAAGDLLEVKVIHQRPSTGDFDSRLQIVENT